MLQAAIVYGGVCLCICLSTQNLENYWSEIDVTRKSMSDGGPYRWLEVGDLDLWPGELFSYLFEL